MGVMAAAALCNEVRESWQWLVLMVLAFGFDLPSKVGAWVGSVEDGRVNPPVMYWYPLVGWEGTSQDPKDRSRWPAVDVVVARAGCNSPV